MKSLKHFFHAAIKFFEAHVFYSAVGLVLVIFLASYGLLIQRQYAHIREIGDTSFDQKLEELILKQQNLETLRQAKQQFESIDATALQSLKDVLPRQNDIPGLFVQMKDLAESLNLKLTSVDVSEKGPITALSTENGTVNQVTITISVEGIQSYEAMKEFFDRIETNMRLLDISAVGYKPGSNSYTVNLSTYYYVEPTTS